MSSNEQAPWEALLEAVIEIKSEVALTNQLLDHFIPLVEAHQRALYGKNGDAGWITKVAQNVRTVQDHDDLLYGKDDEPGLKGQMYKVYQTIQNFSKLL